MSTQEQLEAAQQELALLRQRILTINEHFQGVLDANIGLQRRIDALRVQLHLAQQRNENQRDLIQATSDGNAKLNTELRMSKATADAQLAIARELVHWKTAVLNGLIVAGIYRNDHEAAPVRALQDLISWENSVALDPLVSGRARELQREAAKPLVEALEAPRKARGRHNTGLAYEAAIKALDAYKEATR